MTTSKKVKSQFTLPELQDDKLIEWDLHVNKNLGVYDLIIGRDILQFLKIDIRFSEMSVEWGQTAMPFKDVDDDPNQAYHIDEDPSLADASERVKRILDAKYDKADLTEICQGQDQLNETDQQKLQTLLERYEDIFDGTLGTWKGTKVELDLVEGAKPYQMLSLFPDATRTL